MISRKQIFYTIIGLSIFIGFNFASIATAHAPAPIPEPIVEKKTEWTKQEVRDLVDLYADKYAVSRETMRLVVYNESHFVYNLPGDNGNSWGACQIHLPDHPYISKDQANDPDFCLDWMAKKFAAGKGRMWTAYRTCILNEKIIHQGREIRCDRPLQ